MAITINNYMSELDKLINEFSTLTTSLLKPRFVDEHDLENDKIRCSELLIKMNFLLHEEKEQKIRNGFHEIAQSLDGLLEKFIKTYDAELKCQQLIEQTTAETKRLLSQKLDYIDSFVREALKGNILMDKIEPFIKTLRYDFFKTYQNNYETINTKHLFLDYAKTLFSHVTSIYDKFVVTDPITMLDY